MTETKETIFLTEAFRRSLDLGLDLIELSVQDGISICKLGNYDKIQYEMSKKEKENKKKNKQKELKELRLGLFTDPNDFNNKIKKAQRLLDEGHKVKFVTKLKGREMQFISKAKERLEKIPELIECKVENKIRLEGNTLSIQLYK